MPGMRARMAYVFFGGLFNIYITAHEEFDILAR